MLSFFSELRDANKLAGQQFDVIFFAENGYYFQYFRHLYEALLQQPGVAIAYITSDKRDAVLQDRRVQAFYLKNTLAGIFPRLQARLLIMTMPDLQNFIFKRSPSVGRYVYLFHALVSTHQQYRTHAFDHYDTVFCTGPQQEREIRATEQLYATKPKECIAYGYPLLEELKKQHSETVVSEKKVLIAPSWYKEGILNSCIKPLVSELAKEEYEVWIRPHPEFIKRNKKEYGELVKQTAKNSNIRFDTSPSVYTHLCDAGHLVTDRSGIAFEYAFATCRPVLFIDTPPKVQNREVEKIPIEPLENRYRHQIGAAVSPGEMHKVNDTLRQLQRSAADYRTSILEAESAVVYPPAQWQSGLNAVSRYLGL